MSWPWAKRHPMPEPAEFIRQNTTALNPDIVSGTPSPAQGSYPRLPSEFVLPGAGTESFDRNREVSAACQNMTATILAGFPDPDDEFYKTLISGALRIGIEYLLVGGGEQELQWQEVYIFFRNEMPETIESLMNVDADEYQNLKDAVVPFKAFADKARRDAASAALWIVRIHTRVSEISEYPRILNNCCFAKRRKLSCPF